MNVQIVGSGPAGATLATLLAEAGIDVVLFDAGQRPALTVGESLVPALVPILRRLGVEDAVAQVGTRKPGVSFNWSADDRLRFSFERVAHCLPPYAYNVHRDGYDGILLARARRAGVRIVQSRAVLERSSRAAATGAGAGSRHEIRLSCSDGSGVAEAPADLIVDATGRARLAAKLLAIPAHQGPRNDVAHCAHFTGWPWREVPGQVVIDRLSCGWSWRIPLRDRVSVGVVLRRDAARALGATPEARLAAALRLDPALGAEMSAATRVSPVLTYSNYQLRTTRGHGPGWVAVGDAFGFVDPMLSPGVFVAQRSAEMLADRVIAARTKAAGAWPALGRQLASGCAAYEREMAGLLAAWHELIESFYDGSMFALYRSGRGLVAARPGRITARMQDHIERQVAAMASGAATTSLYSRGLLRTLRRFGMRGHDPRHFAIDTSRAGPAP